MSRAALWSPYIDVGGEVLRSHQQTYDEDHLDHLGQMNPQIETHGEQWSGGDCCLIRVKIFPSNLTDSQQTNKENLLFITFFLCFNEIIVGTCVYLAHIL